MEFAPGAHRAKPITKAQLRKLQASYAESNQYTTEHQQKEEEERKKFDTDFDESISTLL